MPGASAAVRINKDRTERSIVRIADRESLEAVIVRQFFAGLPRVSGPRIRVHCARSDQRFLHIMPATRFRTGVSAFVRDTRGAQQSGIKT